MAPAEILEETARTRAASPRAPSRGSPSLWSLSWGASWASSAGGSSAGGRRDLGSECCTVIVIVLCGVTCSVGDCKSCVMDDVCGECSDGFSIEGGRCVSSGTNRSGLSADAIAGISVAVVVVVGGLVGFLCWWFVCRGKA
eukprot:XP_001703911.1 VSP [Giardia lamblia ATCC 50803]